MYKRLCKTKILAHLQQHFRRHYAAPKTLLIQFEHDHPRSFCASGLASWLRLRGTGSSPAMFTGNLAHAQFRTSVQGVVTDPTGAVIPGATLTLKNNSTNATVVRTSDSSGVFNFNALPADTFTLTVDREGFAQKVLSDLTFIPEQANSLTVQMSLAGASQQITVSASTVSAMDTETANIGGTITDNQLQHMPSWNRDPLTLTQLVPGVISDGAQSGGGGVYTPPACRAMRRVPERVAQPPRRTDRR